LPCQKHTQQTTTQNTHTLTTKNKTNFTNLTKPQKGDTLYAGPEVRLPPIPCFSPELFAYLRCAPSSKKAFQKG
jgi:peptide subunit release factor RF-3